MSVTTATVHNPFQEWNNSIEIKAFCEGKMLDYYLPEIHLFDDMQLVVAVNGIIIEEEYHSYPIYNNDIIAISVSVDASMAGAIAAWATGMSGVGSIGAAWTASYGIGMTLAYAAVYIVAYAAIGYGMSLLASALAPNQEKPDGGTDVEQTYGWGTLVPSIDEGNPIPLIFGLNKVAGQVINEFVSVVGNNQHLHSLMALCDHELDSITDIEINGQPSSFFKAVTTATRLGTLTDTVIDGFNEIVEQKNYGSDLDENSEVIKQTDGNAVEKLNIFIVAPGGIYYTDSKGRLKPLEVSFIIKYRVVGETTWITDDTYVINAVTNETVRKTYPIDSLAPAQYEISVTRTNPSFPTTMGTSEIQLSAIQEIIKEDLIYPGLSKYAVSALATGQLSGSRPTYTCMATKSTVQVHNGTAWVPKAADNPAWIVYTLLLIRIPYSRLIYEEFQSWADFCSEDVSETATPEKRFVLNTVINSSKSLWDKAQELSRYADATIVRKGTRYGVFVDKQSSIISHLFTMGNINENSFSIQYLPQKDRANAVEIEYTDPDKNYTRHVITVMSEDYNDSESYSQKASISVNGAISYDQAVRMGVKQINDNKYLSRVITFDASIDSFACTLGDLIYFQHEIPDYDHGVSGRILSATSNTVTFDQEVTLAPATTYKILIRLLDDTIVEKTVITTAGTYTTITVDSNFSSTPDNYDVFALGIATLVKKTYRIVNITRADDFSRTLSCVEYIDEIYTDGGVIIEDPPWEDQIQQAVNVNLREILVFNKNGGYGSNVRVSWHPAYSVQNKQWAVWLKDVTADTDEIKVAEVSSLNHIIQETYLEVEHSYRITICPAEEGLYETENTDGNDNYEDITLLGKIAPPSDVLNFNGQFNSLVRTVNLSWTGITDIDLQHYEIREKTTGTPGWDAATLAGKTVNSSISFAVESGTDETKTYYIKAFDTSEIYSENEGEVAVAIDTSETPLSPVTGLTVTSSASFADSGEQIITMKISWDENLSDDFYQFQILIEKQIGSSSAGDPINPIVGLSINENQYYYTAEPATKYWISVRAVDISTGATAWSSQVEHTTSIDSVPPGDPSGLTASALWSSIIIHVNHGNETDLDHFDIYRHTADISGSSAVVGTANFTKTGNFAMYTDVPPTNGTYFYWAKGIDTSGNASGFSNSDSAAAPGIGDGDITTVMIGDDQIIAPKILAGEIGTDHLAAGSVIAGKIDVDQLSAITANLGTIITGIIQNATVDPTTWLDLINDTMSLGGKLTWDGVKLLLNGWNNIGDATLIDGGRIHAGSRIQIGNTDGTSNFCLITAGELLFSRYFNEEIGHQVVRSLKQIKYGSCVNGTAVTLDGYWANKPIIHVSPKEVMTYKASETLYNQSVRCPDPEAIELSTGRWQFTPQAVLMLSDGAASRQVNVSDNSEAEADAIYVPVAVTATTAEYTILEANTRAMNILMHCYGHAEEDSNITIGEDTHATRSYYQLAGTFEIRVYEDGTWTSWDDHGNVSIPLAAGLNVPISININISATVDITKIQARVAFDGSYERVYKQPFAYSTIEVGDWHGDPLDGSGSTIFYCEVEIVSYQSELLSYSALSEGELNYIAVEGTGNDDIGNTIPVDPQSPSQYLAGWNLHKVYVITIDHTEVDSDLYYFPVPIALNSSQAEIFNDLGSSFTKMAIATSDAEELYIEVEQWDASAEKALLHVSKEGFKISSTVDTKIYLYYDYQHAVNTDYVGEVTSTPAKNVWDIKHEIVFNYAQNPAGGANSIKDSTSNANHGTPAGSMTSGDLIDGTIGKALEFDGIDDYIEIPNISDLNSSDFTVEAVIDLDDSVSNPTLVHHGDNSALDQHGWLLDIENSTSGGAVTRYYNTSQQDVYSDTQVPITRSNLAMVYNHDDTEITYYIDGVADTLENFTLDIPSTTEALKIGVTTDTVLQNFFKGIFEQFRISTTQRSASWIKTINSSRTDSLLSIGKLIQEDFTYLEGWNEDNIYIITIDNTKIDSNLTHLPVPIPLNSSQHGIFTELYATNVDDDFTGTDGDLPDEYKWTIDNLSVSGTSLINSNKLRSSIPNTSADERVKVISNFLLSGDFDIQVDYTEISNDAPSSSVSYPARLAAIGSTQWISMQTAYGWSDPRQMIASGVISGNTATTSFYSSGKLRITRVGSVIKGYYWTGTQWEWDSSTSGFTFGETTTDDVVIWLMTHGDFDSGAVTDFDNFVVNSGTVTWSEDITNWKKIAVATEDGTQLYVEKEQFNDSSQKALFHVSEKDFEINSAQDTKLYLYYDSTHTDNDDYVGEADVENTLSYIVEDDFTGTDGDAPDINKWNVINNLVSGTALINSNKLRITIPSTSADESITIQSSWVLQGDFDIQVDYDEISNASSSSSSSYPAILNIYSSGKWLLFGTVYHTSQQMIAGSTGSTTAYCTHVSSGKLRLVRVGSTIKGYYWTGSQWEWDGSTAGFTFGYGGTDDLSVQLRTFADFDSGAVTDFDNFVVNSGTCKQIVSRNIWQEDNKLKYTMAQDPSGGTDCILDSTLNENHGTPSGSMTSGDLIDGATGKAIDFDGSNDYFNIDSVVNDISSAGEFSFIGTFKRAIGAPSGYETLFSFHGTTGNSNRLVCRIESGETYIRVYFVSTSDVGLALLISTSNICDGNLHHVAITYNASTKLAKLFIDGIIEDSETSTEVWVLESTGRGSIGQDYDTSSTTDFWDGRIDSVQLFNDTRSDDWIKADYNAQTNNLLTIVKKI